MLTPTSPNVNVRDTSGVMHALCEGRTMATRRQGGHADAKCPSALRVRTGLCAAPRCASSRPRTCVGQVRPESEGERARSRFRVPWGRKPNEPAGPLGLELAPQILGQHPSQAREEVGPVEGRRLDCIGGEEGEKASGREGKRARAVSGVGERSDCAHVRMRAHVPGSPRNCFLPLSFHADTHQSVGSLRRTGRSAWKYSKKSGETSRSSAG